MPIVGIGPTVSIGPVLIGGFVRSIVGKKPCSGGIIPASEAIRALGPIDSPGPRAVRGGGVD